MSDLFAKSKQQLAAFLQIDPSSYYRKVSEVFASVSCRRASRPRTLFTRPEQEPLKKSCCEDLESCLECKSHFSKSKVHRKLRESGLMKKWNNSRMTDESFFFGSFISELNEENLQLLDQSIGLHNQDEVESMLDQLRLRKREKRQKFYQNLPPAGFCSKAAGGQPSVLEDDGQCRQLFGQSFCRQEDEKENKESVEPPRFGTGASITPIVPKQDLTCKKEVAVQDQSVTDLLVSLSHNSVNHSAANHSFSCRPPLQELRSNKKRLYPEVVAQPSELPRLPRRSCIDKLNETSIFERSENFKEKAGEIEDYGQAGVDEGDQAQDCQHPEASMKVLRTRASVSLRNLSGLSAYQREFILQKVELLGMLSLGSTAPTVAARPKAVVHPYAIGRSRKELVMQLILKEAQKKDDNDLTRVSSLKESLCKLDLNLASQSSEEKNNSLASSMLSGPPLVVHLKSIPLVYSGSSLKKLISGGVMKGDLLEAYFQMLFNSLETLSPLTEPYSKIHIFPPSFTTALLEQAMTDSYDFLKMTDALNKRVLSSKEVTSQSKLIFITSSLLIIGDLRLYSTWEVFNFGARVLDQSEPALTIKAIDQFTKDFLDIFFKPPAFTPRREDSGQVAAAGQWPVQVAALSESGLLEMKEGREAPVLISPRTDPNLGMARAVRLFIEQIREPSNLIPSSARDLDDFALRAVFELLGNQAVKI